MVKFSKRTVMITPPQYQLDAAFSAGREVLDSFGSSYSAMVPDDALRTFVSGVVSAALNAVPQPKKGTRKCRVTT